MPYYRWQGIDLAGNIHAGKTFAKDVVDLDSVLLKQEIALLKSSAVRQFSLLPVTIDHKINVLRHLNELLKAGVLLPEALTIVACQPEHGRLYTTLNTLVLEIHQGNSLLNAMQQHPKIFDAMILHMVEAGSASGKLSHALTALTHYLEVVNKFRKKLFMAMIMPVCTFVFFCFIAIVILAFVIPHYVHMFSTMHQELPWFTALLVSVSNFLVRYGVLIVIGFGVVASAVVAYGKTEQGKQRYDRWLLRVPYVGKLVCQSIVSNFLNAVTLLLDNGVQLVPALNIAGNSVANSYIASRIKNIAQEVAGGLPLCRAMMHEAPHIFGDDVITVVRVGQESGNLSDLLSQAAQTYQDRVKRSLHFVATIAQPLFMVVLGILITTMIFAIYMPIINLSQVL